MAGRSYSLPAHRTARALPPSSTEWARLSAKGTGAAGAAGHLGAVLQVSSESATSPSLGPSLPHAAPKRVRSAARPTRVGGSTIAPSYTLDATGLAILR